MDPEEDKVVTFEKLPINQFMFYDYHIITLAQNQVGQAQFTLEITVIYTKVQSVSSSTVKGILFLIFFIIVFYLLSMLHASKKVDLFILCKKKPLTQDEIARQKYAKEISMALDDMLPVDYGQAPPPAKKDDESSKDSFFDDDPYIGHTAHRTGVSDAGVASILKEPLAVVVEEPNPDADVAVQVVNLERQPSFGSDCE
jgi:hypothetical protein